MLSSLQTPQQIAPLHHRTHHFSSYERWPVGGAGVRLDHAVTEPRVVLLLLGCLQVQVGGGADVRHHEARYGALIPVPGERVAATCFKRIELND